MATISSALGAGVCCGNFRINAQRPHVGVVSLPRRRVAVSVRAEAQAINPEIGKSEEKEVDCVEVDQLSKPLTASCRSATFPLCDGSRVKHNKATGDNVGPLLLKKQKE